MPSKAELITGALLAKGVDPTDREKWAQAYREHSRFSKETLEDIITSYQHSKAVKK